MVTQKLALRHSQKTWREKVTEWRYHYMGRHTRAHTHTQRRASPYTDKHKSTSRGAITVRQAAVRAV